MLALVLVAGLALAEEPAPASPAAAPASPAAALLSVETPTRTLSFSMADLQRLDRVSPVRTALRLAPGVYAPREGGLYLQGAPAGYGSFRLDGIIIDRP